MNNYKTFTKWGDAAREVATLIPFTKKYFCHNTEDMNLAVDNVQKTVMRLMDEIKEDFPSILNPSYPATKSLSVSAREVGFRASGFFSFGWRTETDAEGKIIYKFRITFFGRNNNVLNEKKLADHGWKQVAITRPKRDVQKSAKRKIAKDVEEKEEVLDKVEK